MTVMRTGGAWVPTADDNPFQRLGGADGVRALVEEFYDAMGLHEPVLTALHQCDETKNVTRVMRDRFAMFLIGWLGGPDDYLNTHGHPRLRMRHAKTPVDEAMRDAWLRSMGKAMDARKVSGDLRSYLDARFAEVAEFLRNTP